MFSKLLVIVFFAVMVMTVPVWHTTVNAAIVTDGLISFWTFDANTVQGDTIEDIWGQNDGTIQGDPETSNDAKIGQAIDLDGAGDFISIDDPQDIPIGNDTYAIEAWFFADTTGAKGIMGWGTWGSGGMVNALRLMGNGFRHYWWGNDLDWATNAITGEWHHVIGQFDGTTRSLWFNGEMVTSDNPAGHNATLADVNIGTTNNRSEHFDGRIDELRLYNRGLTEEEIQENFEAEVNNLAVTNSAVKLPGLWGEIKTAE